MVCLASTSANCFFQRIQGESGAGHSANAPRLTPPKAPPPEPQGPPPPPSPARAPAGPPVGSRAAAPPAAGSVARLRSRRAGGGACEGRAGLLGAGTILGAGRGRGRGLGRGSPGGSGRQRPSPEGTWLDSSSHCSCSCRFCCSWTGSRGTSRPLRGPRPSAGPAPAAGSAPSQAPPSPLTPPTGVPPQPTVSQAPPHQGSARFCVPPLHCPAHPEVSPQLRSRPLAAPPRPGPSLSTAPSV